MAIDEPCQGQWSGRVEVGVVDPLSGAVISAVALTEGIKFLYGQAGELIKRRRERWAVAQNEATLEAVLDPPPGLLAGEVRRSGPDDAQLDRVEPELRALRRALGDYAEDLCDVDSDDGLLREQVDALRRLLEIVYGQRITFAGEEREPSGPFVAGTVSVDEVLGDVAAVRVKTINTGRVVGDAWARTVGPGGRLTGVETDRIGPESQW